MTGNSLRTVRLRSPSFGDWRARFSPSKPLTEVPVAQPGSWASSPMLEGSNRQLCTAMGP